MDCCTSILFGDTRVARQIGWCQTSLMSMSNNPFPPPPADIWDSSPYRQVLENLTNELPPFVDLQSCSDSLIDMPRPSSRLGGFFGSSSRKDKGKNPLRGLFRSRNNSGYDAQSDLGSSSGSRHGHGRAQTIVGFERTFLPYIVLLIHYSLGLSCYRIILLLQRVTKHILCYSLFAIARDSPV